MATKQNKPEPETPSFLAGSTDQRPVKAAEGSIFMDISDGKKKYRMEKGNWVLANDKDNGGNK